MSRRQTILESQLLQVQARITEIEAEYANIIKIKSYGRNYNATVTGYQDFGAVGQEYRELLDRELSISVTLDEIDGTDGGSFLAEFRSNL